ncbi:hypothetical protein Goshw_005210 [Gossypium schwendimanii]|uniref:DUF4283 domain-containing protein n=1 Tax=Gossypium schwendimanii TaxID=34291 RepID=A0A7J9LE11_GOSSC|nr:hypothetical protein [Gossypium schwendimanii]
MTSATLPTVDLTVGANSSGSNSGVGRAMKKVNLVSASSEKEQNVFMEEDFALTKGDVLTEMVEGVPSITFLDRGEIGFNVLLNKITLLWNPKCPIQLMDIENDFFLVRFQDENDYNKALIGGLWVSFGRYLIVRPWSLDFSISRSGIESQVIWIRLLELPKGYYSDCLLRVIDKTIGSVVKLDVHTDCARMGFARLVVWVNWRKPLMSKVRINNHLQRVEYEALPNIYFKCGLYGHGADLGSEVKITSPTADFDCASPMMENSGIERWVEKEPFGPWMVVEQRKGRSQVTRNESNDSYGGAFGGSWFATLGDLKGENLSDVDGKIDDEMEDRN